MRPLRRPRTVITALLVTSVAALTGCSPDDELTGPVGVTEGLRQDLEAFRDADGLYVDPVYFAGDGGIYPTALLQTALGTDLVDGDQLDAVRAAVCGGEEPGIVGEPWYTWAAVVLLDGKVDSLTDASCLARDLPALTGELETDGPQLAAWAQTGLALGESPAAVAAAVDAPLRAIRGQSSSSAYVHWRVDQLETALGLPSTAADRPAAPPARLSEPEDLMDLWGYTERCGADAATCADDVPPGDDEVVAAERYFRDDVSLAAALSVLRLRGADDALAGYADVLADRRAASGLLRPTGPTGDVRSTFAVLQIAPELFPGPDPQRTVDEIQERLEVVKDADPATRLKAIALLKALDEDAWQAYRQEVDEASLDVEARLVTDADVQRTVDELDALRLLVPDAPRPRLEVFEVTDDRTRHLAQVALANSDMFANDDEVRGAFPDVVDGLVEAVAEPREPLASYLSAANAVSGAGLQPTPDEREEIAQGMATLQGCTVGGERYDHLFRATVAADGPCTFVTTWQAIRSGFVDVTAA